MAATSVILDIRANTNRALNEFKRFSSQLDNKFLISGLKLDVVRSALGQINREFQKAIGEQGLAAGQSMRQAENQAAAILGTFKSLGGEAAMSITEQFSSAFSKIAVELGGTTQDVQKALSASSFISTNLPEDLRNKLAEGLMRFQVQARQAGFGENYAQIIQQYLMGQVTARDLANSGDALKSRVGVALAKASGTDGAIVNAEQLSKAVLALQATGAGSLSQMLAEAQARANWGKQTLEQLNARLFNPKEGVFGVLREVTLSVGDKTSIFRETQALVESVFGRQGFFVNFFAQISKIFGIEDPLKVVIKGVRRLTRQFDRLTKFLESEQVRNIVDLAQKAVEGVVSFFQGLYVNVEREFKNPDSLTNRIGNRISEFFKAVNNAIKAGDWDPSKIQESIKSTGSDIREFIRNLGKSFRETDLTKQSNFIISILGTLVEEVARTIGAVISEGIKSLFSEKGIGVIAGLIGVINKGLTGFFSEIEIFGDGVGGVLGAVVTGGLVAAFGKKLIVGIVAFGAKLIAALPGGAALNRYIGGRFTAAVSLLISPITNALRRLGQAVSRRLRNISVLSRFFPVAAAPAGALGAGGGVGFQSQVINRMDAIIRLLGRQLGIDSPIASDLPTGGRGRRGGQGRGIIQGRDGRSASQRLQSIRNIRQQRIISQGGIRGLGARATLGISNIGSRFSGAWSALPGWGKAGVLGTVGLASILGLANSGKAAETSGKPGELPPEIRAELAEMRNYGASKEEVETMRAQYMTQQAEQKKQEGRENTRSWLGLGSSLAGGLAGGKAGAALGAGVGSLFGGVGAGPGAAIGGVLGSILGAIVGEEAIKLISDPVLDAIGRLGVTLRNFFTVSIPNWWNSATSATKTWIDRGLFSISTFFTKIIPDTWQSGVRMFTSIIPSKLKDFAAKIGESLLSSVTNFNLGSAILSGLNELKERLLGGGISNNYSGSPGYQSAINSEVINSGKKPIAIANAGEIIIPPDGFPTLANAISRSITPGILSAASASPSGGSANVTINFNIAGNLDPAAANEIERRIVEVLEREWNLASTSTVRRGAII